MSQEREIEALDQDRLLSTWRWLCPQPLTIIDRNAFGDLFLCDNSGRVHKLDVGVGSFLPVAESEFEFRELAEKPERREEWFAEKSAQSASERGITPGLGQCIGFNIPTVFAQGGGLDSAYVADIYDVVGFLGDLHHQIADLPDGSKVKLVVRPDPSGL